MKLKAYVLEEIGRLEYKEVGKPVLKMGEVLVEVQAAGICGSDIPRIFQTGTYNFPLIPGHEFSGRVVKAFEESDKIWIGKRVGIFPLIPCGSCFACKEEKYEMCCHYNYIGSRCNGGFAEYVAVPTWNVIELPEKITFEEAAMLEPASVALHAVRRVNLDEVKTVALFGLGTIGILMTQWLHIFGIKVLFAVGHQDGYGSLMQQTADREYQYINSTKEDSTSWIMEQTNQEGVDLAIDCAGTKETIESCLKTVRPGGHVLVVGNPKGDIELEKNVYWKILRHQIRLTGTWNSSFHHSPQDDWQTTIQKCCEGKLLLKNLITHKFKFDELDRGLDIMNNNTEFRNKIMICK